MKRSEMVKLMGEFIAFEYDENIIKANTVCKALLYFMEEEGILPPNKNFNTAENLLEQYPEYFHNDGYHGIVCKSSHRDYMQEIPNHLIKYLKIINYGQYSIVKVIGAKPVYEWELENAD